MSLTDLKILLVEDSIEDIDLILTAFEENSCLKPQIAVATDGQQALDYINKENEHKNAPTPELIILDLNMPKKNGHEVLSYIKTHPDFKTIPIIIFSTSRSAADIKRCYENHTNCYICKPMEFTKFVDVIKEIENFWFSVAQLPTLPVGGVS